MKNKKLILPEQDLVVTNGPSLSSVRVQVPTTEEKVFLGVPTRTGMISAGTAQAAMVQSSAKHIILFRASKFTNLECNYNMLLCDALNLRDKDGVKWFAMLHDDIQPDPYWIDTLIGEAIKYDADIMSAHVPLKDPRQLSSTAMSDPLDPWMPFIRLTLKQIHHEGFPETVDTKEAINALFNLPAPYTIACPLLSQLLVNTGCMVMRVDRPWMDQIHFHKKDDIVKVNGTWEPMSWTEDWLLAQDLHAVGAKVMATRKVNLTHWDGVNLFHSKPDKFGQNIDESTIEVRDRREPTKELKLVETP